MLFVIPARRTGVARRRSLRRARDDGQLRDAEQAALRWIDGAPVNRFFSRLAIRLRIALKW